MTRKVAVVLAISLLINGFHLLFNESILKNKYFASNVTFLLSVCLVVRKLEVFPNVLWRKCSIICTFLELPLSIILLETSLFYIWRSTQDYILLHSDEFLVYLGEEHELTWLMCNLWCGKNDFSESFAALVIKLTSFAFLLSVCSLISIK